MDGLHYFAALVCAIGCAIFLVWSLRSTSFPESTKRWLVLALIAAIATNFFALLSSATPAFDHGTFLASTLIVIAVAAAALVYLEMRAPDRWQAAWLITGAVWLAAFLLARLAAPMGRIGTPGWLAAELAQPSFASLVLALGFLALTLAVILRCLHAALQAPLPEAANRAAFWLLIAGTLLAAPLPLLSGTPALSSIGSLLLLAGLGAAAYALRTHQVIDLRRVARRAAQGGLGLLVTATLVYGLLAVVRVQPVGSSADERLTLAVLAVAVSGGALLLYTLINRLTAHLFTSAPAPYTAAQQRFSQQLAAAESLEALHAALAAALRDSLGIQHVGVLLVSESSSADLDIAIMVGTLPEANIRSGRLPSTSYLVQRLLAGEALTHYAVEIAQPPAVLDFLRSLHVHAYVPLRLDGKLDAILAVGPKANGAPIYPEDMLWISTLSNQMAVAVKNDRLVSDLRRLNANMAALNTGLESTRQQLQKLDGVKTDFITIASHELRTPLAQMRGYNDMIEVLNSQGLLDEDRLKSMTDNLRKATERMEELIAAMLDVSQLDVDAMDLRFTPTTAETVVRLAIEPMTEAANQRKLTISARSLRSLPPIQADTQRLVQALRNVIVNAVKFTPDNGQIEIIGSELPAADNNGAPAIMLAISDSGIGIAPENLELIFGKFFRAHDPSLHSTGTYKFMGAGPGLGLTIARGVIEGHGGRIWAESTGFDMDKQPGSTFYIIMPLEPPAGVRRIMTISAPSAAHAAKLTPRSVPAAPRAAPPSP